LNYKEMVLNIYPEANVGELNRDNCDEIPGLPHSYYFMFTIERGVALLTPDNLSTEDLWRKAWEDILEQLENKLEV